MIHVDVFARWRWKATGNCLWMIVSLIVLTGTAGESGAVHSWPWHWRPGSIPAYRGINTSNKLLKTVHIWLHKTHASLLKERGTWQKQKVNYKMVFWERSPAQVTDLLKLESLPTHVVAPEMAQLLAIHTERVRCNVTSAWCSSKNGNNCCQARRVFTQKAESAPEANNGGDAHFSHWDESRILCGWGVSIARGVHWSC